MQNKVYVCIYIQLEKRNYILVSLISTEYAPSKLTIYEFNELTTYLI